LLKFTDESATDNKLQTPLPVDGEGLGVGFVACC